MFAILLAKAPEAVSDDAMVQRFRFRNGSPEFTTTTTNADGRRLICRNLTTRSRGYILSGPDANGMLRVRFDRGACRGHDAEIPASSVTAFEPRPARRGEPVGVRLGENAITDLFRRVTGTNSPYRFRDEALNAQLEECGIVNGTARGVVVSTPNPDPEAGYSIVRVTESSNPACINRSIEVPNGFIDDGEVGSSIAEGRLRETEEDCAECEVRGANGTQEQVVRAMEAALNLPISLSELTPLPQDLGRTQCENIIRSNGEPGQVGILLLAAMKQHQDCYFGSGMSPHPSVCGGFSEFSDQEKVNFWLYTFAAIAKDRSNCEPERSSASGKYDGLFNLPYAWRDRRDQGLDQTHCQVGGPSNSRELGFQANCAVATLAGDSCEFGARVGSGNSYWNNLQQSNGSISNILKRFPGCN